MYQRVLHNLVLLRTAGLRNEPNPISGQSGAIEPSVEEKPTADKPIAQFSESPSG